MLRPLQTPEITSHQLTAHKYIQLSIGSVTNQSFMAAN